MSPTLFLLKHREMQKLTFREQLQGFPFGLVFVVAVTKMVEPIAFSSLFPYVYFMVRDLGVVDDPDDIAQYTGYLALTFSFCQAISAMHWGQVSDKYGRKPVLMWGMFGCLCSMLMFGFSKSFVLAFVARSLMGLLNGNAGVSRCIIGEVAPNKRHQAIAFLVMPFTWNLGGIFGPLIGGTLSRTEPGNTWLESPMLDALTRKYPYALPNIVIAVLISFAIVIIWLFLEETHPDLANAPDRGLEVGRALLRGVGIDTAKSGVLLDDETEEDETTYLSPRRSFSLTGGDFSEVESVLMRNDVDWLKILTSRVLNPILLCLIMQAHFVVFNEFLPVFSCLAAAYDEHGRRVSEFPLKLTGGLGYSAAKAGRLLSSSGFFGVVVMLGLYPIIDRTFNPLHVFRTCLATFPVLFAALPYVVLLLPKHISDVTTIESPKADLFLYVFVLIRVVFASSIVTTILVMINANAPPEYRGVVNGLSTSASSFAGCFGPVLWGYLISLGQKLDMGWLSWWLLGALSAVGFVQGLFIDIE